MGTTRISPAMLEKVQWSFATIAEMKADKRLRAGDSVQVRGYFAEGDCQNPPRFTIVTAAAFAATPDEKGDHAITSSVGGSLVAQLVVTIGINAEWLGIVADGVETDRSARWQEAFHRAADLAAVAETQYVFFSCHAPVYTKDQLKFQTRAGGIPALMHVDQAGTITAIAGGTLEADVLATSQAVLTMKLQSSNVFIGNIDANRLCSGFECIKGGRCHLNGPTVYRWTKFGALFPGGVGGAMVTENIDARQWNIEDAEFADDANFTGDSLVVGLTDFRVLGGFYGWSRCGILLLGRTPGVSDSLYPPVEGRNIYCGRTTENCSDCIIVTPHILQGRPPSTSTPNLARKDNLDKGGPIGIECWNPGGPTTILTPDLDACTIQQYGSGLRIYTPSWRTDGRNCPINGRTIVVDPRLRIYRYAGNVGKVEFHADSGSSVGFYEHDDGPWDPGYDAITLSGRAESGAYTGAVQLGPDVAPSAEDGIWDPSSGVFPGGATVDAGDFWIVDGEDGDAAITIDGQDFLPGWHLFALVNSPSTTTYAGNWHTSSFIGTVPQRIDQMGLVISQGRTVVQPRQGFDTPTRIMKPDGVIEDQWGIAGDLVSVSWDGSAYQISGEAVRFMAQEQHYRPAHVTITGVDTLTVAELINGLIEYTGGAAAVTMPLGTELDDVPMANHSAFDFHVINTGSDTMTLTAAVGVTTKGVLTVAAASSAHFRVRRVNLST
jgi:hypothetical protein